MTTTDTKAVTAYMVERADPQTAEDRRGLSYGTRPLPAGWDSRALAEDVAQRVRIEHSYYAGPLRVSVWPWTGEPLPRWGESAPAGAERFEFAAVPTVPG